MFDNNVFHTGLSVTTPPMSEAITRELARQHLRVDSGIDDTLIDFYIATAREDAEKFLGRALLTQTLTYTISRGLRLVDELVSRSWNRILHDTIELPRAPVQSVLSVALIDSAGVSTTLDPSLYLVSTALQPARVRLDWQQVEQLTTVTWPLEEVQIAFTAGYANDNSNDVVPKVIIHALLLMIAFYYEHRGDAGGEMPAAAERLLWKERLMFFGS